MPELPEVETIARLLRDGGQGSPSLLRRRVQRARLLWARTLAEPAPAAFSERICGQIICNIGRRAKFLVLNLSADTLLIHLRMSGDLSVRSSDTPFAPHDRLILDLDGGLSLIFNDARKFGRVWLTDQPQAQLKRLGPEPLDQTLTPDFFYQRLQATHRRLKPLLLDQSFLAGLGNIYTDEALHLARLHPLTPACHLSPEQSQRLLDSIRIVLQEGIRHNGASLDWVYRGGNFQNHFRVYRRTGEPCLVCGKKVERILVGQRSTHFCPGCQQID